MLDRMTGPGFELTRTERGGHAFVRFGRGSREAAQGGDRRITLLPAAVAAAKSAAVLMPPAPTVPRLRRRLRCPPGADGVVDVRGVAG